MNQSTVAEAAVATPALLWGGTGAMWFQTIVLIVSAIAAVYVIWHNGKKARERALIDILLHQKSDPVMQNAQKTMRRLRDDTTCEFAVHLSNPANHLDEADILLVLNNLEFIAVGIRLGAFEENLYKQMQWSSVVNVWDASQAYIEQLRRKLKHPTLFQDFECLAKRWKRDVLIDIRT